MKSRSMLTTVLRLLDLLFYIGHPRAFNLPLATIFVSVAAIVIGITCCCLPI